MRVLAAFAALCLAAGAAVSAQERPEAAFARQILTGLQAKSFASNREFCGIIGRTADGRLIASHPRRGQRDGCRPRDPLGAATVIASFHTHAGFDAEADSELPSVSDVRSDMDEGLDGYLATPGGRFWFIDGQTGSVRQICGPGCLPADPAFEPGIWKPVRKRYSLSELERREAQY